MKTGGYSDFSIFRWGSHGDPKKREISGYSKKTPKKLEKEPGIDALEW